MLTRNIWVAAALAVLTASSAFAQSFVSRNTNATGPTPEGFYRGIPHYQDNEPHCDRNPLLPSNIVCMANGYGGADDAIGDAWPRIYETQDNARTWLSRYATGSSADASTSLGLGFGADPIMNCFPGGCAGFFIASNRAPGGGTGGGVYMQLMPEYNIETGFRHFSEAGPRTVQLGTGDNFLDKIDAIFLLDTDNPGTVPVTMTVEKGKDVYDNDVTEVITREWPKGRFIVVYASINSSSQNIRIFSTYSDNYGADWSPPKQVANTTGNDTGVAVAAIGDNVAYLYRQFQDDSGGEVDAVYAAMSTTRGQTIRKPSLVLDNLCAFDQPTLAVSDLDPPPSPPPPFETIASRTNNFVDVTSDGSNFVAVLANRLPGPDGCMSRPFNYQAGSRVLVTTFGSSGSNWSTPVEIAPRTGKGFPRDGHSFQFMPAVDCVLGQCQAIWYDSILDSIRNISYLESSERGDLVDDFVNFPFFADFYVPRPTGPNSFEVIQFRRTADVFTRRFTVGARGAPAFVDAEPVRVTKFPLIATSPSTVSESEQLPFSLKQYKGNTASFMGDYIGLASQKFRVVPSADPTAPPKYEPNNGPASGPLADLLKPSWFAYWTDTRNARGQLYTQNPAEAVPFEKTKTAIGGTNVKLDKESEPDETNPPALVEEGTKLSAEGLEDFSPDPNAPIIEECTPPADPPNAPGEILFAYDNQNRIKDADIFGALIEEPATAWVLNVSKGLGQLILDPPDCSLPDCDPEDPANQFPLQRAYTIAARNEFDSAPRKFIFRIMNQPVGFGADEARASWLQLPFKDFDNSDPMQAPEEVIDATAGPQSSVTVTLFIVSELAINPVTVNVYEVEGGNEIFVETLTVNGALQAGDLITPFGFLPNVNEVETHDPFVFPPTESVDFSNPDVWNPDVWNPDVWNPDVWNPDVWNPDVWNPDVWNPDVWNPDVWNPDVWNPDVWNVGLDDADHVDNTEIPSPDLSKLKDESGVAWQSGQLVAKVDVQFAAQNIGNTTTGYTADFAVNSPLVRQLILDNKVTAQIIVWEDAREDSYQACDFDATAGENRILAVADITSDEEAGLTTLKIPDIVNNRFGSITYYVESGDMIYITIRFVAFEGVIRAIAPELSNGGISYVVTSQAANTYEVSLNPGFEQAIENNVPPLLTVNAAEDPVKLRAEKNAQGAIGAVLPSDLITVTPADEFEPTPTVSCDSGSLASPVSLGEFAPLGLGTSELSCSATGENNVTGTVTFSVDVVDQEPPVLDALPADFVLERELLNGTDLSATLQPAADVWDGPEDLPAATDNIDTDVMVSCEPVAPGGIAPFYALSSTSTTPASTSTEVTCTATDDSGGTATATFTVTVKDTTPPLITDAYPLAEYPSGLFWEASEPGGAYVPFTAPTATDFGQPIAVTCEAFDPLRTVESGDFFPIGDETTVTCTATDDVGLTAQDQFKVTVADTTSPDISDAPDEWRESDTTGGAYVSFTAPTATDFGQPIAVTCEAFDPLRTVESGDFFPIGETTVTCRATDGAGLEATASFLVTVADTEKPVLTVPADISEIANSSSGMTVDFDPDVSATDINLDTVSCVDQDNNDVSLTGDDFPVGVTTVTCTATDSANPPNTATASFTVTIKFRYGTNPEGISIFKPNAKTGTSIPTYFAWKIDGVNQDVGDGNQSMTAKLGTCPGTFDAQTPGKSGFQLLPDLSYQRNFQAVDDAGDDLCATRDGTTYCLTVTVINDLIPFPGQSQSGELTLKGTDSVCP